MLTHRIAGCRRAAITTIAVAVTAAILAAPGAVWASEKAEDGDTSTSITTPSPVASTSAPSSPGEQDAESIPPEISVPAPGDAAVPPPATTGDSSGLAGAAAPPARPPLSLNDLPLRALGSGVVDSIRNNFGSAVENQFTIGRPISGGTAAGKVPAGLEDFYSQTIDWQSCSSFGKNGYANDPRFSCGYAIVPLDYTKPAGPTIAMSMLRVHAAGTHKKGTLFMDPGGARRIWHGCRRIPS